MKYNYYTIQIQTALMPVHNQALAARTSTVVGEEAWYSYYTVLQRK